jgi:hypothetical protein
MKHLKDAYETLATTPDLLSKHPDENTYNIHMETTETLGIYVWNTCRTHMQHPDEALANIRLAKTDETFGTYT